MAHHRELLRQRRELLGYSLWDVALRMGVSVAEYRDVESYDDELAMVLPLKHLRLLSKVLGLELEPLVGLDSRAGQPAADARPRHIVLAEARKKLGVSTATMADAIGFYETFVHAIETDEAALEDYPFEVLKIVADYLKLDWANLLVAGRPPDRASVDKMTIESRIETLENVVLKASALEFLQRDDTPPESEHVQRVKVASMRSTWGARQRISKEVTKVIIEGIDPFVEALERLPPDLDLDQIAFIGPKKLALFFFKSDSNEFVGLHMVDRPPRLNTEE
jgi:transcriptional regulator with XRE-family HTH domain